MDRPWKVIFAFVGVFIAGAVFGGVFSMRAAGKLHHPAASTPELIAHTPPPNQAKTQVAGPHIPPVSGKMAGGQSFRPNPITPQLMNQFTKKLPNLSPDQKKRLGGIFGRAGEDLQRLRQENFADTQRVAERMYVDVAEILSPEQRDELEKMRLHWLDRMEAEKKKRLDLNSPEGANRATAPAPAKAAPTRTPAP